MKQLGIQVAQAILSGDMDMAYNLASDRKSKSWSVSEARAIRSACDKANKKFKGCEVSFSDFL